MAQKRQPSDNKNGQGGNLLNVTKNRHMSTINQVMENLRPVNNGQYWSDSTTSTGRPTQEGSGGGIPPRQNYPHDAGCSATENAEMSRASRGRESHREPVFGQNTNSKSLSNENKGACNTKSSGLRMFSTSMEVPKDDVRAKLNGSAAKSRVATAGSNHGVKDSRTYPSNTGARGSNTTITKVSTFEIDSRMANNEVRPTEANYASNAYRGTPYKENTRAKTDILSPGNSYNGSKEEVMDWEESRVETLQPQQLNSDANILRTRKEELDHVKAPSRKVPRMEDALTLKDILNEEELNKLSGRELKALLVQTLTGVDKHFLLELVKDLWLKQHQKQTSAATSNTSTATNGFQDPSKRAERLQDASTNTESINTKCTSSKKPLLERIKNEIESEQEISTLERDSLLKSVEDLWQKRHQMETTSDYSRSSTTAHRFQNARDRGAGINDTSINEEPIITEDISNKKTQSERKITINDIESEEEINRLTISELKDLLVLNGTKKEWITGVEKKFLQNSVKDLWKQQQEKTASTFSQSSASAHDFHNTNDAGTSNTYRSKNEKPIITEDMSHVKTLSDITSSDIIKKLRSRVLKKILAEHGMESDNIESKEELQKLLLNLWRLWSKEKNNDQAKNMTKDTTFQGAKQTTSDSQNTTRTEAKGEETLKSTKSKTADNTNTKKTLADISSVEQIHNLSVSEIKAILRNNNIDFSALVEKVELEQRLAKLWEYNRKEMKTSKTGKTCINCNARPSDCMFLNCGHLATCTQCGSSLKECPICHEYVTRAVKVYST